MVRKWKAIIGVFRDNRMSLEGLRTCPKLDQLQESGRVEALLRVHRSLKEEWLSLIMLMLIRWARWAESSSWGLFQKASTKLLLRSSWRLQLQARIYSEWIRCRTVILKMVQSPDSSDKIPSCSKELLSMLVLLITFTLIMWGKGILISVLKRSILPMSLGRWDRTKHNF